jgi:branched-chain amino acid transport system substrate-binding protein
MSWLHACRLGAGAAGLTLACALAACGGSDTTSTTQGTSATGTASSAPAATTAGDGSLADAAAQFQQFVGGSAGAADGSKAPITFGYINDEGGIPSFPEGSAAADAAVKLVNEHLGGLDGHPIQLEKCLIAGNEEQGQACAQKFRNDDAIPGVLEVSASVGAGAYHATMGGAKPTIIGSPNAPADGAAKNAFALSSGIYGVDGFAVYAADYAKAKTASVLFPGDDPAGQAAGKQVTAGLEKRGVTVSRAGYSSAASSFLAPAASAGVGKTDIVIALLPSPSSCIAAAKAFKTVAPTTPVLALGACLAAPVKDQLGDYPQWSYLSVFENPYLAEGNPTVGAYDAVMAAYAGADANFGGWAPGAFAAVLTAVKMGNQIGADKLDPDTLAKAMQQFQGPAPLSPPALKWGAIPPLPAIGSTATRVYTYEGGNTFSDATDGKWIG